MTFTVLELTKVKTLYSAYYTYPDSVTAGVTHWMAWGDPPDFWRCKCGAANTFALRAKIQPSEVCGNCGAQMPTRYDKP